MGLIDKSEFVLPQNAVFLNTAAQGLVPRASAAAAQRYFLARADRDTAPLDDVPNRVKSHLATLIGMVSEDIALVGSTSEGINHIYSCIDFQPADNVVVLSDHTEFPSVALPAVLGAARGKYQLRVVPAMEPAQDTELIANTVDERTRLVFVSHVSYRTGMRLDIEAIAAAVDERSNAIIAVDASQSLGVIPIPAARVDFVVATAFKWLMGAHGLAILVWNRDRFPDAAPRAVGWHSVSSDVFTPQPHEPTDLPYAAPPFKGSADRFQGGNSPYLPAYVLAASLERLQGLSQEQIEQHALELSGDLVARVKALGLPLLTPEPSQARAGIVAWADADCERTAKRLRQHGIIATGNAGRVRLAVHLYNDQLDLDAFTDVAKRIGLGRD